MDDVEHLIHEQLARHGIVDLPPYARREIDWIAGTGLAPDHEDDARGPALGAAIADMLLAGGTEVVGINEAGKLVFVGTGRAHSTNRRERRRAARRSARRL